MSSRKNKIRRIVDLDTGEYLEVNQNQRIEVFDEGDMHIKKASRDSYKKNKKFIESKKEEESDKYMSWDLKHYSKTNTDELKLLLPELNKNEKIVIFSILPYVGYDDCLLRHTNGKELNIESISKISGLSVSTVEDVVVSLRYKDILYKGKNSRNVQYFINPWICSRGNRINKVLKTMFKNYKIRTLGVRWKGL